MTSIVSLTVDAGLQAEQDLLASVCAGDAEFSLLFWQPSDRALVMPRRLNRLALSLDCQLLLAGDASDLAQESLAGTSIGCLGNEGTEMRQRLKQFLAGTLDT